MTPSSDLEVAQKRLCESHGAPFVGSDMTLKLGYAVSTEGMIPINGLRHPPTEETSGWYIWCGEVFSEGADFFVPLHGLHLLERCPEAVPFLGLPPGYRFLKAGDYVDVWYDGSLLNV